jgi:hypothetical protein
MNALLVALVLVNAPPPPAPPAAKASEPTLVRGEKLQGLPKVELAALLKDPSASEGKAVALEGKVRKACEKKGCWMELAGADKGPGVRVTFKDYGFFVPLDSAGSTVKIEGVVSVKVLSEDMAKHYEAREVQLVASGLELRK